MTSNDGLINCGSDCSQTYSGAPGQSRSVSVTATPKPGWKFDALVRLYRD